MDNIQAKRLHCIQHANNMLNASKIMLDNGFPNISYHLATLSLEEIGKSVMIVIGHVDAMEAQKNKILKQAIEDHPKKIFWALWGPIVGKQPITPKEIEHYKYLSSHIHQKRMEGIYVDPNEVNSEPHEKISIDEASSLISLVEARVRMEEATKLRQLDENIKNALCWFCDTEKDPLKIRYIYSEE